MITADECLKNAADCYRMARAATELSRRDALFTMARAWETLANNAARLSEQTERQAIAS